MTIDKFLESKKIKSKEIENNFQLVTTYSVSFDSKKGCPHCKDTCNQSMHEAEAWSAVMACVACDCLMLVHFTDRMSGCHVDTVKVYEDKNRPMYRLYFKCDIEKDCIECRWCGNVSSEPKDIQSKSCHECGKDLSIPKQYN